MNIVFGAKTIITNKLTILTSYLIPLKLFKVLKLFYIVKIIVQNININIKIVVK